MSDVDSTTPPSPPGSPAAAPAPQAKKAKAKTTTTKSKAKTAHGEKPKPKKQSKKRATPADTVSGSEASDAPKPKPSKRVRTAAAPVKAPILGDVTSPQNLSETRAYFDCVANKLTDNQLTVWMKRMGKSLWKHHTMTPDVQVDATLAAYKLDLETDPLEHPKFTGATDKKKEEMRPKAEAKKAHREGVFSLLDKAWLQCHSWDKDAVKRVEACKAKGETPSPTDQINADGYLTAKTIKSKSFVAIEPLLPMSVRGAVILFHHAEANGAKPLGIISARTARVACPTEDDKDRVIDTTVTPPTAGPLRLVGASSPGASHVQDPALKAIALMPSHQVKNKLTSVDLHTMQAPKVK